MIHILDLDASHSHQLSIRFEKANVYASCSIVNETLGYISRNWQCHYVVNPTSFDCLFMNLLHFLLQRALYRLAQTPDAGTFPYKSFTSQPVSVSFLSVCLSLSGRVLQCTFPSERESAVEEARRTRSAMPDKAHYLVGAREAETFCKALNLIALGCIC